MVYLAADLSISGGKLVKGHLAPDGRVIMETVHEFPVVRREKEDGTTVWDLDLIFGNIVEGMRKAGKADSIAFTSWCSDFVLLTEQGSVIGDAVSFTDGRTERLESKPDRSYLYPRTGLQPEPGNTLYQLLAVKDEMPEAFEKAAYLLFIPDYLAYRLTGVMKHEYTMASLSELADPGKHGWDYELIDSLGLPVHLFTELSDPGTEVGHIKPELAAEIGYDPLVMLVPSYRNAAKAAALPVSDEAAFILGGEIIGTASPSPVRSEEAMKAGFSNEGGYGGAVRLVRKTDCGSIIGRLAAETGLTRAELAERAGRASMPVTFDLYDSRLADSASLSAAVSAITGKDHDESALAASVYESAALSVKESIEMLESLTGRSLYLIETEGEGADDDYLNELIAMKSGRTVTAFPADTAALGSIVSQMLSSGELQPSGKDEAVSSAILTTRYRRI